MDRLHRSLVGLGILIICALGTGYKNDNGTNPDEECPCQAGKPAIAFTKVPAYGSYDNLQGCVCNASLADHKVAVFIYVNGWWTKPYWANPLTSIQENGVFKCDITTGGQDRLATEIAAYLVPKDYEPPLMRGGRTLPAELDLVAVAKFHVMRSKN